MQGTCYAENTVTEEIRRLAVMCEVGYVEWESSRHEIEIKDKEIRI